MDKIKLEIPRISNDSINLTLKNGDQFFIVGPNGSGKSALIHRIVSMNTDKKIKRISAHRQTWLSSGSINFTPESREAYEKTSLQYITRNEARWRDSNAGQDLSAILFDLVAKENTRARLIAQHVDNQDLDKRHYNELVLNLLTSVILTYYYDRRLTHDQFSRSQGQT